MEAKIVIDFPVFNYDMTIVYTDDIVRSREELDHVIGAADRKFIDDCDGLHSFHEDKSTGFIFFTPDTSIGVIAHECYHAISRMLRWIGAKKEEEVVAYHLSYLLDKVLKFKDIKDKS